MLAGCDQGVDRDDPATFVDLEDQRGRGHERERARLAHGAQIARAAEVNEGYASRVLETLLGEGLIERSGRGRISEVDWPGLIRRRAQALTLFRPAGAYRYVARVGPRRTLGDLAQRAIRDDRWPPIVTGSFAAERLAVVAPPTQLVIYTMDRTRLADDLSLFEVDSGADVVLIRPDNASCTPAPNASMVCGTPRRARSRLTVWPGRGGCLPRVRASSTGCSKRGAVAAFDRRPALDPRR